MTLDEVVRTAKARGITSVTIWPFRDGWQARADFPGLYPTCGVAVDLTAALIEALSAEPMRYSGSPPVSEKPNDTTQHGDIFA